MSILKSTVIAITGTLPHSTKEIQGWVARNGGRFSLTITKDVTHLLASKEAYKSRNESVQQAMALNIPILSYDWFDDSLQARRKFGTTRYLWEVLRRERRVSKQLKRSGPQADAMTFRKGCNEIEETMGTGTCDTVPRRKPRKSRSFFFSSSSSPSPAACVPDTPFISAKEDLLRRRAERTTAQEEAEAEAQATLVVRGVEHKDTSSSPTAGTTSRISNPELTPSLCVSAHLSSPRKQAKITHFKDAYHYYHDVTGFEYKICLVRSDFSCNGVAKYYVALLESHAKPHVYWSIVQYQPAKKSGSTPKDDNEVDKVESQEGNTTPLNPNHQTNLPTPSKDDKDNYSNTIEATRLTSLITRPAPNPNVPYNGELCPRTSPFVTALRTFRHAFQDLTLLAWEDRFSPHASKTQLLRAQQLNYEPFIYCKPKVGMPVGLFPQAKRSLFGHSDSGGVFKEAGEGGEYVRGKLDFPIFERGLDGNGRVGMVVARERERRRVEEEREEKKEKEKERKKKREEMSGGVQRRENGADGRGFVAPEFEHLLSRGGRKR